MEQQTKVVKAVGQEELFAVSKKLSFKHASIIANVRGISTPIDDDREYIMGTNLNHKQYWYFLIGEASIVWNMQE